MYISNLFNFTYKINTNKSEHSSSFPHFLWLCFLFLSLICTSVFSQDNSNSANKNELNTKAVDASLDCFHDTIHPSKIEQALVYPGCENHKDNDDLKKCLYGKLFEHVRNNVNSSLFNELGLKDEVKVYVRFKVNVNGDVTGVEARSPHPVLSQEGERVVYLLPKMQPARAAGKPVNTVYTLPITFQAYQESLSEEID